MPFNTTMNEGGQNATSFASIAASRPPAASFAALAGLATDSSSINNINSSQRRVTPPSLVDLTQDDETRDELHEQTTVFPFEVDDDDEDEESTQQHTPVGSCDLTIVGIRYYNGTAHPGEYVNLVREPNNPYDRNAIRVDNMRDQKVGHIKREQAAILAPLLDDSRKLALHLEATIPRKGNTYVIPLAVDFHAVCSASTMAEEEVLEVTTKLGQMLKNKFGYRYNFRLATDTNSSSSSASSPIVVQTRQVDWQTQAKELDDMFDKQSKEQLENLPNIAMPTSQFADDVQLFDYQSIGIRWLVHQETKSNDTPLFFKQVKEKGNKVWLCDITQCSQENPPKSIKGGILADEMGLGKTLQTIGLILAAPPKGHTYPYGADKTTDDQVDNNGGSNDPVPNKSTIQSMNRKDLKMVLKNAGLTLGGNKDELVNRVLEGVGSRNITGTHFPMGISPPPTPGTTTESPSGFCTLIACPVSVMSNWDQQIRKHVKPGVLNVGFYAGSNRCELIPKIKSGKIDVLLVSYHTLGAEFKKIYGNKAEAKNAGYGEEPIKKKSKQESLFDITFHRFVLDEAHTIRSCKTGFFKSCLEVKADRKLALTGTPFVNRPDDIHSLLSFLEVAPLADKAIFKRAVTIPIQSGHDIGLSRLRTTMAHIALRRSKALANIKLVGKDVQLRSVSFPDNAHKKLYDALFGTVRAAFGACMENDEGNVMRNYSSIFEKLLRMRQSCCSATLVPAKRREAVIKAWNELQNRDSGKKLTPEEGMALLEKLKGTFSQEEEEQLPECAVCLTEMEEHMCVILRVCSHIYCEACISRVVAGENKSCPLCRKPIHKSDLVKKKAAVDASQTTSSLMEKAQAVDDEQEQSPKILALLETIKEMQQEEKGVIFSQFTSFLNLIGEALKEAGLSFTRIDGSMSASKRIEAVESFCSDDDDSPRFILCSLHAAGTGINLTRGSWAFMMDCWWNQAVENQAMDRIHRIGQQRDVKVIRFVMAGSIEERMVALQEAKSMQAKGSMQKLSAEEQRRVRLDDLKGLLLLEQEDN